MRMVEHSCGAVAEPVRRGPEKRENTGGAHRTNEL